MRVLDPIFFFSAAWLAFVHAFVHAFVLAFVHAFVLAFVLAFVPAFVLGFGFGVLVGGVFAARCFFPQEIIFQGS